MAKLHQISIFHIKKLIFIIYESKEIAIQSDKGIFFESDGLTLETPRAQLFLRFFPPKIFSVKKRQLSESTKIVTITSSS